MSYAKGAARTLLANHNKALETAAKAMGLEINRLVSNQKSHGALTPEEADLLMSLARTLAAIGDDVDRAIAKQEGGGLSIDLTRLPMKDLE